MEKLTFDDFLNRFKALTSAKNENEIARMLGIRQNTFSVRKKKGEVPYKELINFLIEKGESLDSFITGKETPSPAYPPMIQGVIEKLAYIFEHGNHDKNVLMEADIIREYERLKESEEKLMGEVEAGKRGA